MHKQDTATLNQNAVAERLRTLQLKQWWVARQIGVTTLTVNRWLTGKVRRINRDNLTRLASILQCDEGALVYVDETDVRATQVEQSEAAKLLVTHESQDLFVQAGQLETYERLLKAVMHPNLTLASLLEIYGMLTLVTGLRGQFDRSVNYAKVKLDLAVRTGAADKELEARINLATAAGALGQLQASHSGLLDLFGAAESQGSLRSMINALLNLVSTYHVRGEPAESIRCALRCLRLLQRLDDGSSDAEQVHWRELVISYVYFAASGVALEGGEYLLAHKLIRTQKPYASNKQLPLERDTLACADLVAACLAGRPVDQALMNALIASFYGFTQFAISGSVHPSILLRRHGRLAEAAEYLAQLDGKAGCEFYERAFIAEEWARLCVAMGKSAEALEWRERANSLQREMGMERRSHDDPALEYGSQLQVPEKLARQLGTVARRHLAAKRGARPG